jgi:hypothetical protein
MRCQRQLSSHSFFACAAFLAVVLASCGGGSGGGGTSSTSSTGNGCTFAPRSGVFVNRIISYQPVNATGATTAQWPYFFQRDTVEGAPCGENASGQFDGVSLGYDRTVASSQGGEIIVGFGDSNGPQCVTDGTGTDFLVFGNGFNLAGGGVYNKIATVAVAQSIPDVTHPDSSATWYEFMPSDCNPANCVADSDCSANNTQPTCYADVAGVQPTTATGGGDTFDLSVVVDTNGQSPPNGFQACYVRLTDGGTMYPDYGDTQTDLYEGGAAIDALQAIHSVAVTLSP